jgi:DnaK suppressor protein
MGQTPRRRQRADSRRVGDKGTGKQDRDAGAASRVARPAPRPGASADTGAASAPRPGDVRARLARERDATIEQLRQLGISPETDEHAARGGADSIRDEGDRAQASERQDLAFATRERLAARINRLAAALERLDNGTYGRCAVCGGPIEELRLAALPEAETCLRCQERREQAEAERAA